MSRVIDIAEAVVHSLNQGLFSQEFVARRAYLPEFALPELADLQVTVVPKEQTIALHSRTATLHEIDLDIGIQQKVEPGDTAAIDALMNLTEEVLDHFRLQPLVGQPVVFWAATANRPIYAVEHLDELGQFTAIVTVTYKVAR